MHLSYVDINESIQLKAKQLIKKAHKNSEYLAFNDLTLMTHLEKTLNFQLIEYDQAMGDINFSEATKKFLDNLFDKYLLEDMQRELSLFFQI